MKNSVFALIVTSAWLVCAEPGEIPSDHILYGYPGEIDIAAQVQRRATSTTEASPNECTNGPHTRSCWSDGFSIATDFDIKWPTTGVTRSYKLTVTNTTCDPDGHGSRQCFLINKQFPGPLITADWGDMISVTVRNNLQQNGTAIHYHGIRQLNNNVMDGVPGLTQCPIPPNGGSMTYTWQATQFGSTWYHSHLSSQYTDGIWGPIVINGPASSNYDIDVGPIPIQDWWYQTSWQEEVLWNDALQHGGPGPSPNNILIGGKNKNAINGKGSYSTYIFTPGKKHLLRVMNVGVDNSFRFTIDGHKLLVVTTDLVPIEPIPVDSLMLATGQRYNVIVVANQTIGNYWMRAYAEGACFSGNDGYGYAIISYTGAPSGEPTTSNTVTNNDCNEPSPQVPWVPTTVGSASEFQQQASTLPVNINTAQTTTNNQNIVVWGINMTGIDVQWQVPTLSYVAAHNTSYPETLNLISLPNEGIWTFWIVQEVQAGRASIWHPMHLHGHDFYVLGRGSGSFDLQKDPQELQYSNPPRRDTTMLPPGGWLVIAWMTDNPGAWLLHCHIAWHLSEGLGVQFLEAPDQIKLPGAPYTSQCAAWSRFQAREFWPKWDSGLRKRLSW